MADRADRVDTNGLKVVVVGAGYAGTMAANRLAKRVPGAEITVVNPRPDFVERVRLHEQIAGTGRAATPLDAMLGEGIGTRIGAADEIGDGKVLLEDGTSLAFDYLFLAVGSTADPMPGTVPVGTWEGAEHARTAWAGLSAADTVTVIGGGLTGIETAAELAGAGGPRVRLVAPELAPGFSPGARRRVHRVLERLGVELVTDTVEKVEKAERVEKAEEVETVVSGAEGGRGDTVRLGSGAEFVSALTLWGIVSGVPDLAARSGLPVNDEGRVLVDAYLRSVDDPRVFAVGDCAAVPGARMACATAVPQAAHAADTLARIVKGRAPQPYSMGYVGQAISLGRKDAVMQVTRRDDTVRPLYLTGRSAAVAKEGVCRAAKAASRTGVYAWLPGPK
ncbi:NAD(P)/FAD-dependent oxidoreductase [Streptomyces sp. NPDC002851]